MNVAHCPNSAILLSVLLSACGSNGLFGDGESGQWQELNPDYPRASGGRASTTPVSVGAAGPVSTNGNVASTARGVAGASVRINRGSGGQMMAPITTPVSAAAGASYTAAGASYTADDLERDSARCGDSPWILEGLVRNSRDLGGVPVAVGSLTCDRLYRGSQFYGMAPKGCTELAALGIRTIIDLRTDSERNTYAAPECIGSLSPQFVNAPMPTPYGVTAAAYIADLEQPVTLRTIFDVLDDEASYPVYFHCLYGRDRTGVLTALILRLLGTPRDVVMAEYKRSVEGGAGATPSSLEAALDRLEALGGAEAYLLSIGVTAESIATVRRILTSAS